MKLQTQAMCLFPHPRHTQSVMSSCLLEEHVGVPESFSKLSFIEAVSKKKLTLEFHILSYKMSSLK